MLMTIIACNNTKENKSSKAEVTNNQQQAEPNEKELKLTMKFKTNKKDEFTFMMNEISVDEFQTKNIHLVEKVSPTSTTDQIIGNFGPSNISNKMIISLGRKEPKELEIISINFEYGQSSVNISPEQLSDYFGFSKYSVLDSTTYKIKTIRVDNQHNPRLYVRKKLWDDLNVKF